ncbi:MAG TPA: hypothetical protein VK486_11150, partial [Thermoleophilaceae bacterium]|nr:hypothetical protein [Thermoleophilaceae bacterium]
MSHARPRLGRHSLVLAIAMLLALGTAAPAAMAGGTVTFDGDYVVYTSSDNLNHILQFRASETGDDIYDNVPFTDWP